MAKSKTKRTGITKKRKETNGLLEKIPTNHGEWLELAIKTTERSIKYPDGYDSYLVRQASRLRDQLDEWRKIMNKIYNYPDGTDTNIRPKDGEVCRPQATNVARIPITNGMMDPVNGL